MKIQKSEKLNVEYGSDVYINTYVSSWGGNVEVKLNGYQSGGDEHRLVIALLKELTQDMENYDKEQAEKAQRELEEAKAQDEE